jgi:hypothetical protein
MRSRLMWLIVTVVSIMAVAACSGDDEGGGGGGGGISVPGVLRTAKVVSIDQSAGTDRWRQSAITGIGRATWSFASGGEFRFQMPTPGGTYDLRGDYRKSGRTVMFQASDSFSTTVGGSQTDFSGSLDVGSGQVQFSWTAGSVSAAVVNDQPFGSSALWSFTGQARLAG